MALAVPATWHELIAFYNNLTLHIVPGPRSLSYFAPFVLVIGTLLTPPCQLSRKLVLWIVLPLIFTIQLHVWVKHKSFDVISINGLLTAFMLLGWYDVRRDFRYVQRMPSSSPRVDASYSATVTAETRNHDALSTMANDMNSQYRLEPYPSSLTSRIRWVSILMSSMRLTDWHIGVPSHDSRQPSPIQPFWKFVRETVLHGGFAYIILDFTSPYMMALASGPGTGFMIEEPLTNRIIRSFMLLTHFYAALALLLALLPYLVSIGAMFVAPSLRSNSLVSPLTWPSHLGPLSSIYSGTPPSRNTGLRAFWGVFWHQNMRHITSTPGIALASTLSLRSGSKSRYSIMITSSFLFSGIIHMGVIPPEPLGTTLNSWEMRFRVASFFWLQIIGIAIEDAVQSLASNPNKTPITRDSGRRSDASGLRNDKGNGRPNGAIINVIGKCIILVWTTSFLAFTTWWTVLPVACEMSWLRMRFIPISVSRYLLL